jgi:hypothetical protein
MGGTSWQDLADKYGDGVSDRRQLQRPARGAIEAKRRELSSVGVGRRRSGRGCVVLDGPGRPGLVAHVGPTLPGRPSAAAQTASSRFPPAGLAVMPQVLATAVYRVFTRRARCWRAGGARGLRWVVVSHQVPADSVVIRMKANGSTRRCSSPPPAVLASFRVAPLLPRRSAHRARSGYGGGPKTRRTKPSKNFAPCCCC